MFNSLNVLFNCDVCQVSITGEWQSWQGKVPQIEVETHKVASPDVVVPTLDTVRHEALLYTWLAEHKPLVLCGPPGSGKTMTLFSALRALPDMEVRTHEPLAEYIIDRNSGFTNSNTQNKENDWFIDLMVIN